MLLTPVEFIEGVYFKRDDKFIYHRVNGGKVRSALILCDGVKNGLVTAGSRKSPQIQIISEIANKNNLSFIAFTPTGQLTPELIFAKNNGAIIEQVYMGFNNNLIKKAKLKSIETGYAYIPFGMEHDAVFNEIAEQVQNIPNEVNRIVVPIGSGMTLIGILMGLKKYNINKPVLGIQVGANPIRRLNKYISDWQRYVTIIKSDVDYHKSIVDNNFKGIELDEIYESKCIPFIEEGDLFWIVGKGIRN